MVMQAGDDCVTELSWEYKLVSCLLSNLASPVQNVAMEFEAIQFSEQDWEVR